MDDKTYKESLRDKAQEQLGENVSVYYTEIIKNNVKKEVRSEERRVGKECS